MEELRRFLYIGQNSEMLNVDNSGDFLKNKDTLIKIAISQGKGPQILKEVANFEKNNSEYFIKKPRLNGLDSIALVLASCSLVNKDEKFSHSGKNKNHITRLSKCIQSITRVSDTHT